MRTKYIIPDSVFFSNKTREALFYEINTQAFVVINKSTSALSVREFLDKLTLQNLFTIVVERGEDKDVDEIIDHLIELELLRCVPDGTRDCSIPLIPILNDDLSFESNVEKKKESVSRRCLSNYLDQVTFYIGGKGALGKTHDNIISKQISYPLFTNQTIPYSSVSAFINQCNKIGAVQCIYEIVVTDATDICLFEFSEEMRSMKDQIQFTLLSADQNVPVVKRLLALGYKVYLLLDARNDTRVMDGINANYKMVIRDFNDFDEFKRLKENGIGIQPELVYDDNLSFLSNNFFIDPSDFEQIKCGKKELFIHQKINLSFWGRLFIDSDGFVYATPMRNAILGRISDSVLSIIYKEFIENTGWRLIRDTPCCADCIYQWLCPSPTALEYLIAPNRICKKV